MAYNVSGLTDYVKQNEEILIKDVVLGTAFNDTIPALSKQLGVKTKERLNYMSLTPVFQEASCGFSAQGSTVFTERDIETAQIKINDEWCVEDLLGKVHEHAVNVRAGEDALPFEAQIMDEYIRGINKEIERQIWVGDTSASGSTDRINGFVTIAAGADSASTISATTASGASAYEAIKQTLALIPDEILDEAVIFVSPATFREYAQDLVAANLYHYEGGLDKDNEMFIPGSSVKVRKTFGLKNSNYIYASSFKNMVYACDMLDAKEVFDTWFSKDNDTFRLKVRFNAGVATYFPTNVVLVERQ